MSKPIEKRSLLAIALCMLFFLAYTKFIMPKPDPKDQEKEPVETSAPAETPGDQDAPPRKDPSIGPATPDGTEPAKEPAEPAEPARPKEPGEPELKPAEPKEPEKPALPPVRKVKPVTGTLGTSEDLIYCTWTNVGAAVESVRLSKYKDKPGGEHLALLREFESGRRTLMIRGTGRLEIAEDAPWEVLSEESTPSKVVMEQQFGDILLRKSIELVPDDYILRVNVTVRNLSEADRTVSYWITGPAGIDPETTRNDQKLPVDHLEAVLARGDDPVNPAVDRDWNPRKLWDKEKEEYKPHEEPSTSGNRIFWAGAVNKYFASVLRPEDPETVAEVRIEKIEDAAFRREREAAKQDPDTAAHEAANVAVSLRTTDIYLGAGESKSQTYDLFAGPVVKKLVARVGFARLHDFGTLGIISNVLLIALQGFYRVTGDYGVSIILLTLLVRLAMHPLTRKSQASMHRMQKLQPQIKELQAKNKGNKQKMGQEQMELFKKHGVNPLSGCLPMLLQLPVLIALFRLLRKAIELRHEPFLGWTWIHDLAAPDTVAVVNFFPFTFLQNNLNILPFIMVAVWYLNSRMAPKPVSTDPNAEMQQKMLKFMPFFFGYICYNMASGLVLYWTVSTLVGAIEQWTIRRSLE